AAWVSNRFRRRHFELFFKSYTGKVWGVPTSEIRAEWAAQRIKGLSFASAVRAAFFGNRGNKVKSLISEFNYPRFGPGQMWEAMTQAIEDEGGEVRLDSGVDRVQVAGGRVVRVEAAGRTYELPSAVISSLPLREVVRMTSPRPPRARLRDPRPEGIPDLRRRLLRPRGDDPGLAGHDLEPAAGRPQRAPPLQQLGPLDAHRDACRRQPARRRPPRHLGGQRRER